MRLMRAYRLLTTTLLLAAAAPAMAQEPLPGELPTVIFLVEDSANMALDWEGDASLTVPNSRWSYVRDAIIQVINNAPIGMTFGVALTADGSFTGLAYPGMATADIVTALQAHVPSASGLRTPAESLAALVTDYLSLGYSPGSPRSWSTGPFQYDCTDVHIILVGSDIGEGDSSPGATFSAAVTNDVQCNDGSGFQGCYADNAAAYTATGFPAPLAGVGAVTLHSLLIDSARGTISGDAPDMFLGVANQGAGLYNAASQPGQIAPAFFGAITDSFSGEYSNAGVSMSDAGDMLFASYFGVIGGYPLYNGHLVMWEVDNDPTSASFGEVVVNGSTSGGWQWDAGQMLASRPADPGETNQGAFNWTLRRNGYTAGAGSEFYDALIPFDSSSVSAGSDLVTLLVDELDANSNPTCLPLADDFDYDCDVDADDAQLLVDFIRGAEETTFLHTGLPRSEWKMGDTGHAVAVHAPSNIFAVATETHFEAFVTKVAQQPSMAYISSNSGMVHAFYTDGDLPAGSAGMEYWFYVPRAKANKDPASVNEFDGFQLDDLMRSGQTYVNDGRLTLNTLWLDGYGNGLTGCFSGYQVSNADGVNDADGCEWHRVLIWAGGYGSRHVYALDVTRPDEPHFLWERTDMSGGTTASGVGRAMGLPAVAGFVDQAGTTPQRRWVVAWGAGALAPNVSAASSTDQRPNASIFIADLDSTNGRVPTNYVQTGFAVPHPALGSADADGFDEYTPPEYGLFGSPALVDLDGDGSVDVGYVGDSLGYVFKVLFRPTTPDTPTICSFATPDATDEVKHVYHPPSIFYSQSGDLRVYYATGSPFETYSTNTGGVYVKSDPEPFDCQPSVAAACAASSTLFNGSGFYKFPNASEKASGRAVVALGRMFFNTYAVGSDACEVGTSRLYGINVETCGGGLPEPVPDPTSYDTVSYASTGQASEPVFRNGRLYSMRMDGDGQIDGGDIWNVDVSPGSGEAAKHVYGIWRHIY